MLQRKMRIGYNRAARMIERMERDGVVGPADGAKPREVLIRGVGEMPGAGRDVEDCEPRHDRRHLPLPPSPERAEQLVPRLQERSRLVDQHEGFLGLEVLRSFERSPEFLLVTRWQDRDALRAYLQSPDFARGQGRQRRRMTPPSRCTKSWANEPLRRSQARPGPSKGVPMAERLPLFATAARGTEDLLAEELTELGAKRIRQDRGGVRFMANLDRGAADLPVVAHRHARALPAGRVRGPGRRGAVRGRRQRAVGGAPHPDQHLRGRGHPEGHRAHATRASWR